MTSASAEVLELGFPYSCRRRNCLYIWEITVIGSKNETAAWPKLGSSSPGGPAALPSPAAPRPPQLSPSPRTAGLVSYSTVLGSEQTGLLGPLSCPSDSGSSLCSGAGRPGLQFLGWALRTAASPELVRNADPPSQRVVCARVRAHQASGDDDASVRHLLEPPWKAAQKLPCTLVCTSA